MPHVPLNQLRRVRWAVRACLVLGVAASVAANILHADRNPIAQTIAAWPPLALLLTVELIARVPVYRRLLAAVRLFATVTIAGIAAWVSYWHMAGVAARYGEVGAAPYLLPLSVDGLVVVASVSLVELAGRIRREQPEPARAKPDGAELVFLAPPESPTGSSATGLSAVIPAPVFVAPPGDPVPVNGVNGANGVNGSAVNGSRSLPLGTPRLTLSGMVPAARADESAVDTLRATADAVPAPAGGVDGGRVAGPARRPAAAAASTRARTTTARTPAARTPASRRPGKSVPDQRPARTNRPVAETRRLAAELASQQPDATPDDLARQLGITTKRLKTVLAEAAA